MTGPETNMECHPLEPFLPDGTRLLMCGTFPPARSRWSMEFYYPNFINDMWRIFGLIVYGDRDALVDKERKTFRLDKIKEMLGTLHVGLSDTGKEVVRTMGNASDKYLDILSPINLEGTLAVIPECVAVATTGEKAAGVIASLTGTKAPAVGRFTECRIGERKFRHWRMPSSSRAYPLGLEKKAACYRDMLMQERLFPETPFKIDYKLKY